MTKFENYNIAWPIFLSSKVRTTLDTMVDECHEGETSISDHLYHLSSESSQRSANICEWRDTLYYMWCTIVYKNLRKIYSKLWKKIIFFGIFLRFSLNFVFWSARLLEIFLLDVMMEIIYHTCSITSHSLIKSAVYTCFLKNFWP